MRFFATIKVVSVLLLACGVLAGCAFAPYRSALGQLPEPKRREVARQNEQFGANLLTSTLKDSDELVTPFLACLKPELQARFRHDPALDLIANESAYWVGAKNQYPPETIVSGSLWRYGRTGLYRNGFSVGVEGGDEAAALDRQLLKVCQTLNEEKAAPPTIPITFGISRVYYQLTRYMQSLVLVENWVDMESWAKRRLPGETLTLKGRLNGAVQPLTVYFDEGTADIRRLEVAPQADGSFSLSLQMPQKAGRYLLLVEGRKELSRPETAQQLLWQQPLLTLPIFVDQDDAFDPPAELVAPPPNPPDLASWPQLILDRTNAERQKFGLAPLALSAEAATLARDYATRYLQDPSLPSDGELAEKLARKGITTRSVYQSRRGFSSVYELIQLNLQQPSWRYVVLKKEIGELGIGIVKGPDGAYESVEYALERAAP